ncbi:MAG TPA: YggT family protein [Ruminiclostridium sp.]
MNAVYQALNLVLTIFGYAILARVIISWLPVSRDNKLVDLLFSITEPVLAPIRSMLSKSSLMKNSMLSMMDFSPIVAYILIIVLRNVITMIFRTF